MPAYVVVTVEITDPSAYEEYRARALATVQKFGGRFLARGGALEVIEGDWEPERVILLEFPDMGTVRRWYDSDDYQAIIPYRSSSSKFNMVMVEGQVSNPPPKQQSKQ